MPRFYQPDDEYINESEEASDIAAADIAKHECLRGECIKIKNPKELISELKADKDVLNFNFTFCRKKYFKTTTKLSDCY